MRSSVAELLRERGEDPVAVNCDAIQVYRGLEVLSGAAERRRARAASSTACSASSTVREEFSAGRFAELAHAEIDALLEAGRRPIVVGGTGLYLRAALAELDLRPPVPAQIRAEVEREIEERGPQALHAELDPRRRRRRPPQRPQADRPLDRAAARRDRPAALERAASSGPRDLRHPTLLVGLDVDRAELDRRIDERVDAMAAAGAAEEARGADRGRRLAHRPRGARLRGSSLAGDVEAVKAAHRRYARRQLTWMRRMEGVPADRPHRPRRRGRRGARSSRCSAD